MISTILFVLSLIVIGIGSLFSFVMAFTSENATQRGAMAIATLLNITVLVYIIFFSVPI